jgi:hypothetical protein
MKQLQSFNDTFDPIFEEFNFGFEKDTFFSSDIVETSLSLLSSLGLLVVPLVLPATKVPVMVFSFLFYRRETKHQNTALLSGFFYEKVVDKESGKSGVKIEFLNVLLASCVTIASSAIIYGILHPEKRLLIKAKVLLPKLSYSLSPLLLSSEFPNFLQYIENCKIIPEYLREVPSLVPFLSDAQKMLASDLFFKLQFNNRYLLQNGRWISNQIHSNNSFISSCLLDQFGSEFVLGLSIHQSPALGIFLATLN